MSKDVMTRCAGLALTVAMLAGCASETLFRSNFDSTPTGQPPTTAAIGTVSTEGEVRVIQPPVKPSGKWVRMRRPIADTGPAVLHANLKATRGDGRYTFVATVLLTAVDQVATIDFAAIGMGSFMHLDLMPNGKVRIDDAPASEFGGFPRNKPFIVQVTFDIDESPTAHIVLAGAGVEANSIADHNITLPPRILAARQFGTVLLSMSFPHLGALRATNISVTRRKD